MCKDIRKNHDAPNCLLTMCKSTQLQIICKSETESKNEVMDES